MNRASILIAVGLIATVATTAAGGEVATVAVPPTPDAIAQRIDAALAADELGDAADLIARHATTLSAERIALAQADYALAAGEVDAALAAYRRLTGSPTVAARAQLGIGLAQLRLGHDALAVAALEAATGADPSSVRAWVARGVAADRQRDWAAADIAYEHALALDGRSAAALTNRGYSRLLRGRLAEAASDSAQALAIDPKMTPAANNLRLARALLGDYKNAFAGSTKASLPNDLNTAGFAAMSRGDYGVAETFFTRAMQLNPKFDRTAWDNLVYLKQLAHAPVDPLPPQR